MSKGSRELESAGLDRDEAEAVSVPESVPSAGLSTGGGAERISQGFLHVTHPDTGLEVVFVPGEALPDWAIHIQNERLAERLRPTPQADDDNAGHKPVRGRTVKGQAGKAE